MQKEIILRNKKVFYTLRLSRKARKIRITIYYGGKVKVTAPWDAGGDGVVEKFMREKARWILAKILFFNGFDGKPATQYGKRDYAAHKEKALRLVKNKVAYFNARYGHQYNAIRIKNQRTCWGSCSKKGNLNFNFRILFLSERMQNYIIVHELCHLKELNHSKKFWHLVGESFPDYLQIKKELRQNKIGFV